MPVLKVWNSKRDKKKLVIVSEFSIAILKEKVTSKLDIIPKTIVLEEDGTEVEDDDVLEELKEKTFMALADGEEWTLPDQIIIEEIPTLPTLPSLQAIQEPELIVENENDNEMSLPTKVETVANLACRTVLPNGLPPPDKISVPDLSPSLKLALQSGEKSAQIFNQTLKECEIFYTTKYPTIADSAYYQAIGKKMITKYPSLAYADGTNPWSFFVFKLGQRIRTQRWRENRKSKRQVNDDDDDSETPSTSGVSKKFRLGSKTKEATNNDIPSEDWNNHVTEIQKEWEGKRSVVHLRTLLDQTRAGRSKWMTSLKAGKIAPVISKFPCFEEGIFVLHEFYSIRNKANPEKAKNDMMTKLESLFQVASKQKSLPEEAPELDILQALEDLVSKKKGKGQKSKSCIKVVKNVLSLENIPKKHLDSEKESPPSLIVFKNEDEVLVIYIVADGCQILDTTRCIRTAVMLLIASYYVFDLDYPAIYGQFLGFLQHWVVGDIFTQNKCTNWINFSEQYRAHVKK
eukprot:XP_019923301.1 PREDICTED: uncharacterized protein LOC105329498 [Crassostrea gigas]